MMRARRTVILGSLLSVRHCAVFAEEQSRRVLLVRHGETNFNAAGRIQGTLESQVQPLPTERQGARLLWCW